MYQKRKAVENLLVLCSDLAALFLSFCIAVAMRYGTFSWAEAYGDQRQQILVIITLYAAITMFTNYYSTFFARGKIDELYAVLREEIIFFVMLVVALYLIHPADSVSRLLMVYFFLVNTLLMYFFRFILNADVWLWLSVLGIPAFLRFGDNGCGIHRCKVKAFHNTADFRCVLRTGNHIHLRIGVFVLAVCKDAVEYAVFLRFLRELPQVGVLHRKDFQLLARTEH